MKNIDFKNKNVLATIALIVVLVVGGLFITQRGKNSSGRSDDSTLPDVQLLPTVDSSVQVSIDSDAKKQEVTLEVSGVPNGTEFIEYELSYEASVDGERVPKGVIGTIEFDGNDPVSRKITLGTCSSGNCKYDKGVTTIRVNLKFEGDYGAQGFEGEFEI